MGFSRKGLYSVYTLKFLQHFRWLSYANGLQSETLDDEMPYQVQSQAQGPIVLHATCIPAEHAVI